MNLKDFIGGGSPELYWAVVLEPGWVEAAVWSIQGEKAQVAATSPVTAWETDDELIDATDAALSAAVQNLPEDAKEPNKCVFGVPPSWVKEGQIKEEYLGKIKKICAELSLVPSGFVVLSEAVSHLLKSEEEAPVSAIILEISKENLEVTVFRLGNLIGTTNVARSVSVFDDVVEGLTRFVSADPLPSRIILYNGKGGELEDLKQELIKSDWKEAGKVNFLHTPKVEILDSQKKVIAVCLAGASEIGNATAVTLGRAEVDFPPNNLGDGMGESEKKEEESTSLRENEGLESNVAPTSEATASDLGFVVGGDINKQPTVTEPLEAKQAPYNHIKISNAPSGINKVTGLVSGFSTSFLGFFGHLKFPNLRSSNRLVIFAVLGMVGIFGLFLLWWFYPKATVTIFVAPQTLQESFNITVDPSSTSNDPSSKKLAGQVVKVEESGSKSQATTGTKTIGDAAKGNVEIRNGTANDILLPALTKITSSTGLIFTLNTSASVSAALSPGNPGTMAVDVTAGDIGSAYNLSKDESFKVANYPKADMDALATNDFSGGSSKEITAVSTDDEKSLKNALENELSQKADQDLGGQVSSDKFYLTGSTLASDESSNFSNKIGDEASSLNLDLKVSVSGLTVDRAALLQIAANALKDKMPSGYVLRAEQLQFVFKPLISQDKTSQFAVDVTANLLPQINTDDIAKAIAGRTPARAEEFFRNMPGFKHAEIKFTHAFPGPFKVIPNIKQNITVEIAAQQ